MSNTLTYKPTTSFPFVYMRRQTTEFSAHPVNILVCDKNVIVDSIFISNRSDEPVKMTVNFIPGNHEGIADQEQKKELLHDFVIPKNEPIDVMGKSVFYFQIGDTLEASLGDSNNYATCIVSYRELNNQR